MADRLTGPILSVSNLRVGGSSVVGQNKFIRSIEGIDTVEDIVKRIESGSYVSRSAHEDILRKMRLRERAEQLLSASELNFGKQYVESSGYLYHFAPTSARESLLEKGFASSEKAKHAFGVGKSMESRTFFYANPFKTQASRDLWTNRGIGRAQYSSEMDLWRIKVGHSILSDLQIDDAIDFPISGTGTMRAGLNIGSQGPSSEKLYALLNEIDLKSRNKPDGP